jgi:diguanylate cyclase (GGDEF)-like protein/PAS domain S-box-containing protein
MPLFSPTADNTHGLKRYTALLAVAWTLVLLLSFCWWLQQEKQERISLAHHLAQSHLEKDLILRHWNIKHGFVYVPVTPETQPNPYLQLPEREIVTPSGRVLTAVNSSWLIRQIYELTQAKDVYRGHLTSLQPLRPDNAPDPWEREALTKMAAGVKEVAGVAELDGRPSFRLMRPLLAGQNCLNCHANYTVGAVAGGISVSLPLAVVDAALKDNFWSVALAHGFLWLAGMLGIIFGAKQMAAKMVAQQEMAAALSQSERNFRLLVQTIPALVYRGYADGRVDFVDNKVEQLTGYSREDFATGKVTWPEIILPEDRPNCKQVFLQALKGDRAYCREYRIRCRNGDILWLSERSQIVLDEQGRIDFVSGVVSDITQRKEMEQSLRESERFWKSILEAVGVGVMVINKANGRITQVNSAAEAMIGRPREEIIDQTREQFFICPDPAGQAASQRPGAAASEAQLRRVDGTLMPIWKTAAPILLDQVTYVLVSFVDLTEQRRAEVALTEANRELQAAMARVEQTNREISLIGKLTELLQICASPEEAFPIISRFAGELFPQAAGALYLLNSSNNLLTSMCQWGEVQAGEPLFTPIDCWGLRQGRPYACGTSPDNVIAPRCLHIAKGRRGDYYCVPLSAQNETLGLLYLEKTAAEGEAAAVVSLSASSQKLAQTLAEHISLSLSNLKLRETLRHQAIRDSLTGLFNRRYLTETLEREIARAQRRQTGLGVIMLDVDHFKRFNDTYGHEAGDRLLAVLGRYLQHAVRAEDIACRYGGEEFTLILPEITPEALWERAEQIRAGAKELEVLHQGKLLGEVTISLGLSYYPQHGQTSEALLQAADTALYQAKQSGRNRVVMAASGFANARGAQAA